MSLSVAPAPPPTRRLVSLDLLRGATVAAMILVNNAGDGSVSYAQLRHSVWNGCTFTDLVFPMFLFIMGVSMALSFEARLRKGARRSQLAVHVARRAALIVLIGLALNALPVPHFDTLRYCGVLQRIGVCYLVAALWVLAAGLRGVLIAVPCLLAGYWLLLTQVPVPGFGHPGAAMPILDPVRNLASSIDRLVIPVAHRYHESFYDPEGLLSTLPAIATVLLGVLTAAWLRRPQPAVRKLLLLVLFGVCGMLAGLVWAHSFPFNKRLWTSSYVLWTGGISITALALLSLAVDGRQKTDKRTMGAWATPWLAFGTNALSAYVLSEVLAIVLGSIPLHGYGTLQHWLFLLIPASLCSAPNRSVIYSVLYVGVCLLPAWWLFRRRIFIKL